MSDKHTPTPGFSHEKIETNNFLMIVLILLVLLVGGLVEIVPLFFQKSTTEPIKGVEPLTALQLAGRDVYIREGCYNCHSQMIRPLRSETLRYGHYSVAGEFVYDRPFQWGSKRTGPDLARVGGKYSDDWQRLHLEFKRVLFRSVIAVGGVVEIVPLFFQRSTTEPVPGLKPYTALQLAGRDIYQREGCYNCHSQMIRPLRAETLRYGHYSTAGEFVYDRPFQWGSKRTGPDLHRVGGK